MRIFSTQYEHQLQKVIPSLLSRPAEILSALFSFRKCITNAGPLVTDQPCSQATSWPSDQHLTTSRWTVGAHGLLKPDPMAGAWKVQRKVRSHHEDMPMLTNTKNRKSIRLITLGDELSKILGLSFESYVVSILYLLFIHCETGLEPQEQYMAA